MDFEPTFQTNQNNSCSMKDLLEPNWILDRRDSGRFFWRRESGNSSVSDTEERPEYKSSSNRVKFRCDVEVLEFLKHDDIEDDDKWSTDEDDEGETARERWRRRTWNAMRYDEDVSHPSTFVGGVCLLVIVCIFTLRWLWYRWSWNYKLCILKLYIFCIVDIR